MNDESRLEITQDTTEGTEIIRLRGELDLTSVDALAATVEASRADKVILDLALLVFVDSAGVRAIDSAHARLARTGRSLLVVAPPTSRAAWTFRIAGFSNDFVLPSLEDASEATGSAPS